MGFEKGAQTRAKSKFLGLWNWSQFLSLENSAIFVLSRSRVTLSASENPVIFSEFQTKSQTERNGERKRKEATLEEDKRERSVEREKLENPIGSLCV